MEVVQLIKNGTITYPKLLFVHYKSIGLSDSQFLILLQLLLFQDDGKSFPSIQDLEQRMGISSIQIMKDIQEMMTLKLLSIEQSIDQWGKMSETYDLDPLFHKLALYVQNNSTMKKMNAIPFDENVFLIFEQTFGRPLSPHEIEYINQWLDQDRYALSLIIAALRESEIVGKLSFRYIDRILLDWSKKSIHSADDAREHALQFRDKQFEQLEQKRGPKPLKQRALTNGL